MDEEMSEFCPVCGLFGSDEATLCDCGYDFRKKELNDLPKLKDFYNRLMKSQDWTEHIKFTRSLHEFQQKIMGKTEFGKRGGWGYRDTANLIDKKASIVSDNMKLANLIQEYPDLSKCKNRAQALGKIQFLATGFDIFDTEDKLQDYFLNNWDSTPFGDAWEHKQSYFNAKDAGEADILARHRKENKWLIIELKKSEASEKSVGQLLRYMGWFKENRAARDEKVEGAIVSSYPPTQDLKYAVSCISDIIHSWSYFLLQGSPYFFDAEEAEALLSEIGSRKKR
jgi:hypothetical protein